MDERDPVADTEFVFRRIHPSFYRADQALPVLYQAFRPAKQDTAGLSVLRAVLAQPQDTLPRGPAKASGYWVARVAVIDIRKLGLTVAPDPILGGPPGHAVIPELSWDAYQTDKARWKPILAELARLASADIVRSAS
jgi:hypothetical protein